MKFFISYNRKDSAFVERLAKFFHEQGDETWIDTENIPLTGIWTVAVHEGIAMSDVVFGILTPESLASSSVRQEWDWALLTKHNFHLIWLRDVDEAQVPPLVISHQRTDFRDNEEQGFSRLQAGVVKLKGTLPTHSKQQPELEHKDTKINFHEVASLSVAQPEPSTPSSEKQREDICTFATDMTFILGAEGFICQFDPKFSQYPVDPTGRKCLQDFIDLVINADAFHFTLPGENDPPAPILIERLRQFLKPLYKASVAFTPDTEQRIVEGFTNLVNVQGRDWLQKWVKFQLINSIVTQYHADRLGGKIISDIGQELLESRRDWIKKRILPKFVIALTQDQWNYCQERYKNYIQKFGSFEEFALAYAFDVYQRGWSYQKASSSVANAAYFPHELRNNALESIPHWQIQSSKQTRLWSWGGWVLKLFEQPEYQYKGDPVKMAELIEYIRDTSKNNNLRSWCSIDENTSEKEVKDELIAFEQTKIDVLLGFFKRKEKFNIFDPLSTTIPQSAILMASKYGTVIRAIDARLVDQTFPQTAPSTFYKANTAEIQTGETKPS